MKKSAFVKSLVLILAMLMLLTACSGNSSSQSSSDPSQSSSGSGSDSAEEAEREAVELVWYTPVDSLLAGSDDVIQAVNEYTQEKLNTTVDIHFFSFSDYASNMTTMVSAGTYMDILLTGTESVSFTDYAARNAFAPLEDYIDEYLPQTKAQLPEGAWDAFTIDGHIYAVPSHKDLALNWDFLLNQNMADDLGLTFPEEFDTMADLIPFLYEAKEKRDAKYPEKAEQPIIGSFIDYITGWYYVENLIGDIHSPLIVANVPGLNGFEGMGDGETAFCPFYTDEYREMVKTIRQMVVDGIIPPGGSNFDPDKVLWEGGELIGQASAGYIHVDEDMFAPYFKTTLYMQDHSVMSTSYVQTGGQAVSATSDKVERALEFIELLSNDTYLATTIRFGVEGDGWTDEDNDNVIEVGPLNADSSNRYWWNWYGWCFGSVVVSKVPQGYPSNFGELMEEFNATANQESNLGFIVDTEPIANEIAACNNVISEYTSILNGGNNDDIDSIADEFIQKLKDNGSDTVIEEVQRQLTEWRASVGKPTL